MMQDNWAERFIKTDKTAKISDEFNIYTLSGNSSVSVRHDIMKGSMYNFVELLLTPMETKSILESFHFWLESESESEISYNYT